MTSRRLFHGFEEIPYQQFISKNKIVRVETKEKQITVLEILEQDGYKWKDGQAPTDYIPYERSRELGLDLPYICMDEK